MTWHAGEPQKTGHVCMKFASCAFSQAKGRSAHGVTMRMARGMNGVRQRRALKRNGVIAKPNGQRLEKSLE